MNRRVFSWIFTFLILTNDFVLPVYHWRISEDGKKIEAVINTPYQLRIPGSLTDFLQQVENVRRIDVHMSEMQKMVDKISIHEQLDNPQFEEDFRKKEPTCIASKGVTLEPESFHTVYSAELCPEFHKSYEGYTAFIKEYFGTPPDNDKRFPRCQYWFKAVKIKGINLEKVKLSDRPMPADPSYYKILRGYFGNFAKLPRSPGGEQESIKKYGQMLASMLSHSDERVSKNAYLHMAAAAWWRAQGHLSDALVCLNTASQFVENPEIPSFKSEAVKVSIGNLLNRAGYSLDAYKFLKSIEFNNPDKILCLTAMTHAAIADSSVLTGPDDIPNTEQNNQNEQETIHFKLTKKERNGVFSKSFENYEKAMSYFDDAKKENDPKHEQFFINNLKKCESKAYVLSCHMRLYEALEKQKENLEKLVTEKTMYQEVHSKRIEASIQLMTLLAIPEMRQSERLFYDQVRYGPNPNRECKETRINKFPHSKRDGFAADIMLCKLRSTDEEYNQSMETQRQSTIHNRPALNDTNWKVVETFARNRMFEKGLNDLGKLSQDYPEYFRMIQPKYDGVRSDESRDRPWRRADWPNSVDCQAVVSSSNPFRLETFPQIFISPENRGWIISELLTKHLTLSQSDSLPLPWFEPRCDFVEREEILVFTGHEAIERLLNKRYDRNNEKYAEKQLKTVLVRLADRVMEDHEIGARIHLLMKYNIGPRWVSLNLAGLYWRVQGNAHQATKCLLAAFLDQPQESFIAITQMAQVILRATGMVNDAHNFINQQLNLLGYREPMFHLVLGRIKLLLHDVDKAIQHLKDALDKEPEDEMIAEDLLKIACSGKSTKPAISSQFPTVCCSPLVQNAVCIKPNRDQSEQCYIVDSSSPNSKPHLIYHRCNGIYDGQSKKTADFANIVSPFLLVFNTVTRRDDVSNWIDQVDGIQTVESQELPLDYGGTELFFTERPVDWWHNSKNEMKYKLPVKETSINDEWEEDEIESDLAKIPEKPLSFLWIKEKSLMMQYDSKLPALLPKPSIHQIRKGVAIFPNPKASTMQCNGVAKLDVLFDNAPSTWVSVTAKGEDIEKYVDLRTIIPAMASLQPICPGTDKYETSPILGLDHIPAFSLSDQFLFYKPEKALAEALKSLGNERDTIEHVAARLHAAMLHNSAKDGQVNWLLCVLSSLYWRVTGDAENAMSCLKCALHTAPPHMRDVALVSLANVCHQAGLLNSALIAAGAALSTSPRLVAIHFTLANIYASIGDYQSALNFYYSTLSLQSNFQPAKDRIRAIYCHSNQEFDFS
ncbi:unnamed protein product [Caenorhabditis angaria]|uniref:Tetratricopeptide repeat protein 17 n=1 Tax=Caenorhabditis angaria TaxID=860376 RepID=A0A9P1N908_9PELO|nr:unnamed protein product [Caenorhabditis angaria]